MEAIVRNQIRQADWPRIVRELAIYVSKALYITFCISGSRDMLPEGLSVEDIVQESIKRLFTGDRAWDPTRIDLLQQLKGTARSIIGNLPGSGDNKYVKRNIDIGEEETEEEKISGMRDPRSDDPSFPLRDPEQLLMEKCDKEIIFQAYQRLIDKAEGDDAYESVILALCDGIDKPSEIADLTGLELKRVYEFKRRWKYEFEDALQVVLSRSK